MRRVFWLLVLVCPLWAQAASFDCEKAASPRERLICSDGYLSQLDSDLARLYHLAMSATDGALLASQRQWIKDSTARCPSDVKCLIQDYEQRRSATVDLLRAAVLEKADTVKAGPYSFKQPRVPLGGNQNFISYPILIGQPEDVAAGFNALSMPPNKWFYDDCEEQNADSHAGFATDKVVTLDESSWMYCEGAAHGYGTESARTIVMRPKPHLIKAEDLFRADAVWQAKLADLSVAALKEEISLDADQEKSVRDSAAKPENWAVTPQGLKIQFGFLAGYLSGQSSASIAWSKLDGLLLANPPFQ